MKNLEALKSAQAAAFAAWKACPASRKGEKARLEAELSAAGRAVTAAKNAAKPVIDLTALHAAAIAAQEARQAEAALRQSIGAAVRKLADAQEWPRCGQDWPINSGERAAQALIDNNPAIVAELES